ncbi:CBS domain-containing protein [Bacteroidota bacterium]
MFKNYQDTKITGTKKGESQALLVGDHMARNLVTLTANQSIIEATSVLIENGFSGASVINDRRELVGMLSQGDCIKELTNERYYNQPSAASKVGDCMVRNVVHVKPELSIFEVAKMFLDLKIRRFPVTDMHGKLIGQISQKDVLKAIQEMKSNTWFAGV